MVRRGWVKTIAFAIRSVDPVLTKEGLGEVVVVSWDSPLALPNLQGLWEGNPFPDYGGALE